MSARSSSSATSSNRAVRPFTLSYLDIKDGVSIPSPLLRRIASLLRLYYQLLVSLFYDNHAAWAASCLSDAAIACVKDFCCSGRCLTSLSRPADCSRTPCTTDLCQLLIDLYRLKDLAPRAAVLDALCGCCRQGAHSPPP